MGTLEHATETAIDLHSVQRRTLRLLFATQVIGGVGISIGVAVGALLAAELAGTSLSGLAQSAVVVGAAVLALPATGIVHRHGRRPSLASAYSVAAVGSVIVVAAAMSNSIPLLFAGFFLFGAGSTAGLQARYAAVDLAPAALRARHLSIIVWATTIGAVAGPISPPLPAHHSRATAFRMQMSRAVVRHMLERGGGGSIVNISSIASTIAIPGLGAYSAAKGGVNQLTRVMAVDPAAHDIRVNAVAPGYLENIMEGLGTEHAKAETTQRIESHTPMRRRARLDELIGPVVFLASDAASYVTGAVLFVDGGYSAA